jgi:hypothetical protein
LSANPELVNTKISDSPYLESLFESAGVTDTDQTVGQAVNKQRGLRNVRLNNKRVAEGHQFSDVPQMKRNVPLSKYRGWQNSTISSVPGLKSVPLDKLGIIGTVDLVLGDREQPSRATISGGNMVGFNYPCTSSCAHIEVGGNPLVAGKQWIAGDKQKVEGGFGALKAVFGGKEPTGRHWGSDKFKVVLTNIDESTDTVRIAFYYRYCKQFLGCTPYGIGPFPVFQVKAGEVIFLGVN